MSKGKKALIISIVAVVFIAAIVLIWFLIPHGKSKKVQYTDAIKQSLGIKIDKEDKDEKAKDKDKGKELIDQISEFEEAINGRVIKISVNGEGELADQKGEVYISDRDIYALINAKLEGQLNPSQVEVLMKDKKLYFTIKEVLKNYYYVEPGKYKDIVKRESVEKIVTKLEDYFIEALSDSVKSSKVEKEDNTITINGETYDTTRYSYTFTGDDIYNIFESFIKKVKDDKELNDLIIDTLKDLMNGIKELNIDLDLGPIDLDNIKIDEALDSLLESLEVIKSDKDLFTHIIHLDENDDVISMTFSINVEEGDLKIPVSLTIDNVIQNNLRYIEVSASGMGIKVFDLIIEQEDKETINFKLNVQGEEYLTGKIKYTEKEFKLDVKSKDDEINLAIDFEMEDDFEGNGEIEYKFGKESRKVFKIKVEEVEEMPKVDVSNSLPYEDMTEEDSKALKDFTTVTKYYNYTIDNIPDGFDTIIPSKDLKSMM